MRIVTEVLLARLKLKSIAEILITNSGEIHTTCGNGFTNEKVWIKVCNSHSHILNEAQKKRSQRAPQESMI